MRELGVELPSHSRALVLGVEDVFPPAGDGGDCSEELTGDESCKEVTGGDIPGEGVTSNAPESQLLTVLLSEL